MFTMIFIFELLIKLIGFGWRYFRDPWNIFDIIIVTASIVGIILNQTTDESFGPQTTIVRSFRIIRVLYVFKKNRALRSTLMTFFASLPAMANIGSLLLIIILMYAILGVNLFAEVKLNGSLDEFANFQTLGTAFLTLIRVTTGEEWPKIMEALSREHSPQYQCIKNPSYQDFAMNKNQAIGCGNQLASKVYFISFALLVSTIFIRLFIAIILQVFKQTTERQNKFMSSELNDHFRNTWALFDPDASGFIRCHSYRRFLIALGEPLGWNVSFEHSYLKQQEYLAEISLPKHNSSMEYYLMDVFEHLILIMIIRREIINFAISTKHYELMGVLPEYDHLKDQFYEFLQTEVKKLVNKDPEDLNSRTVSFVDDHHSASVINDRQRRNSTDAESVGALTNIRSEVAKSAEGSRGSSRGNRVAPIIEEEVKNEVQDDIVKIEIQEQYEETQLKYKNQQAKTIISPIQQSRHNNLDTEQSLLKSHYDQSPRFISDLDVMGKTIAAPQQNIELKVEYESRNSFQDELYTDDLYKSFNREKGKDVFNQPSILSDSERSNMRPSSEQQNLVGMQQTLRDFRFDLKNFKGDDLDYEDIIQGHVIDDQEDENLLQDELNLVLFSEEEEKTKEVEKQFHQSMQLVQQEIESMDLKKDLVGFETVEQQDNDVEKQNLPKQKQPPMIPRFSNKESQKKPAVTKSFADMKQQSSKLPKKKD